MTGRGNITVSKVPEANMALSVLSIFLGLLLEVSTHGPTGIPRTSWKHQEVNLIQFAETGIFNYSVLLLNEDTNVLYVGAREAIFELDMKNISVKTNEVFWKVPEEKQTACVLKGKSRETECLNYIRVLQVLNDASLYVCGTYAFQPTCDYLSLQDFELENKNEDGRGRCSFDPAQSFTSVMVDGDLYSGTAFNFLGSEPIIHRSSPQVSLRTEYSISWLNEPSFVFADVIRESKNSPDGDDDKIYFFFTEVSVEYEFVGKLSIPRIARVCKGDLGGQRTLQKKWTSFLKAKLVCSMPELNFVFNVVHDVFILKTPDWKETVIYGVFTSQWGNIGLSAVCAYNMSTIDEVFSKGKYMQKASVEQSHTKWVRFNAMPPSPRPGACINNIDRLQNISDSLRLPDKTLQFIKDHPLMDDQVLPIGNGPKLIRRDVNYTQIVVDRVRALDNNVYDVIFTSTDKGVLHKAIIYDNEVHVVEEIQLFTNFEPIKTLLLSSQGKKSLYAGSDAGVVQSPTAFCEKYMSCTDCILARDPYCAWDSEGNYCVVQDHESRKSNLIQNLNGDANVCPPVKYVSSDDYQKIIVKPGNAAELQCQLKSNLAKVVWKLNGTILSVEDSKYHLLRGDSLLILSISEQDLGNYECWSEEQVKSSSFAQLVAGFVLSLDLIIPSTTSDPTTTATTTTTPLNPVIQTEGNANTAESTLTSTPPGSTTPTTLPPQTKLTPTSSTTVQTLRRLPIPISDAPNLETKDPSTEYIKSNNSNALLLLFLLFFILFLALMAYNCYMQFLPPPCLKLRAALLGSNKKAKPEYMACEAGLMEPIVEKTAQIEAHNQNGGQQKGLRDTGYETEPDCSNGKIPTTKHLEEPPESKDKPFDVICESQPIEYADADAPC
ncbi:semaphorin-4D-like isoform X1 [Acipenser ruthenus]|uniref:semaphorin-4D-like isoform X1 n=2 Tax=Acipenser ruthenus TaxID=7906 RepID=UPI00155FF028|nr:semaphorin-4D-like isoform X1 [Acipenser ruthenus]XP_058848161.1 semaphorin-4D-like isoform X1 [Acipenser ruthenus]XP_058848167.1 semaphorin-4D-like isoform X1 [Acipenser ruthenus]XP_058848168.1 semaphorin-4D-like isoform X1 [Acipenser ruthenus]